MDTNKPQQNETPGGEGRVPQSAGPDARPAEHSASNPSDISEVDRQEGAMHNGALGGNFGESTEHGRQTGEEEQGEGK